MKPALIVLKIFLILIFSLNCYAQKTVQEKLLTKNFSQEEVVSISETLPFNNAIEILSLISEKNSGKKIVSTVSVDTPIGLRIENMFYKKALIIIVQYKNLEIEEKENVIIIRSKEDKTKTYDPKNYADVDEPEVKISAVFFEANITAMDEKGINWEFLLNGKGVKLGGEIVTFGEKQETQSSGNTQSAKAPDFNLSTSTSFKSGNYTGTAAAAFKFFQTENLGEIIARPSINVRDKIKGKIQIGSDLSIKQKDFSGNIVENFIPTGTIIDVTPYIYKNDGLDYCLLKLHVERSSANVEQITTEIKKTSADTEVLLINGEETIIGGLFVNEDIDVRRGIPILKDLPWWFFGIRYLTGYESKQTIKKEIIILIKAEIIPSLKERLNIDKNRNLIKDQFDKDENEIQKLKIHKFNKEN